jgi:hypothetical protein
MSPGSAKITNGIVTQSGSGDLLLRALVSTALFRASSLLNVAMICNFTGLLYVNTTAWQNVQTSQQGPPQQLNWF